MKKVMIVIKDPSVINFTSNPEFKTVEDNWQPEPSENTVVYNHRFNDYNYFSVVDNQVRSEYTLCEEFVLLPKVEALYLANDISMDKDKLVEYPTEGYYYKTEGLRRFFQLVRNLQENPSVYDKVEWETLEVEELKWLFENSIWGTVPSMRSKTGFPRMKDILTHSMNDLKFAELWTIPNIMSNLEKFATGNPNLVELAYLTGDVRCLCAGAETNSLYREMSFAVCSGCGPLGIFVKKPPIEIHVHWWDVSEKVEKLGTQLVNKYNEVMTKFTDKFADEQDSSISYTNFIDYGFGSKARKTPKYVLEPTLSNYRDFKQTLESPRVAMLGQLLESPAHYHWILDNDKVTELWADGVLTTENYKKNKGAVKFDKWDMSGVKDENGNIDLAKLWSTKSVEFNHPEINATNGFGGNGIFLNQSVFTK